MLRIVIEFDPEAQAVTKIDAPQFKNLAFLAAVLDMAQEQAKFEANLHRAAVQQKALAVQQQAHILQNLGQKGMR